MFLSDDMEDECDASPQTILTEKGLCYVYNADQRMEFKKGALVEF